MDLASVVWMFLLLPLTLTKSLQDSVPRPKSINNNGVLYTAHHDANAGIGGCLYPSHAIWRTMEAAASLIPSLQERAASSRNPTRVRSVFTASSSFPLSILLFPCCSPLQNLLLSVAEGLPLPVLAVASILRNCQGQATLSRRRVNTTRYDGHIARHIP